MIPVPIPEPQQGGNLAVMADTALTVHPGESVKRLTAYLEQRCGLRNVVIRHGVGAPVASANWTDEANLPAALTAAQRSLTPAPDSQIAKWIAEVSLHTPKRRDDAMTEDARLAVYLRFLRHWPGDVVHWALCVETWKFFPSRSELEAAMERHAAPRRSFAHKLSQAIRKPGEKKEPARPDDAARKRMAELVAKNFTARGAEAEKQRAETGEERDARHADWKSNPVKPSRELVAHVELEERRHG